MEISKENFNNFETLLSELKEKLLGAGREIVREALENRDNEIFQRRDKKRFRGKGKRKTCVKTWFGAIEYERQVYADLADPEHKHYVYLYMQDCCTSSDKQLISWSCQRNIRNDRFVDISAGSLEYYPTNR